jgi:hypothetical protein
MFLWELIADRLRCEGWSVWHREDRATAEPSYTVTIHRADVAWRASGPTLTDAFAAAARRARAGSSSATKREPSPHFNLTSGGLSSSAA